MAISPQVPKKNAELRERHRLEYAVLSDAGNAWAASLGAVYTLPDELRALYEQFEIDLADHNGDSTWALPLSARLVVAGDGRIRSIEADPDYTRRPELAETLEVLMDLG